MKNFHLLFYTVLMISVLTPAAHAYIDPGTGSFLLQLLAAAVLGSLFGIKMAWRRIVDTVRVVFGMKPQEEQSDDEL